MQTKILILLNIQCNVITSKDITILINVNKIIINQYRIECHTQSGNGRLYPYIKERCHCDTGECKFAARDTAWLTAWLTAVSNTHQKPSQ